MRGDRAEAEGGRPVWRPGGDPLLDSAVSHYHILGLLGRGGMGVVYRARDERTGGEVALKVLAAGRMRSGDERFRREARAAASLDHPNIAKVLEIGEHQGHPFLAMPLYEGETLKKRLDRADEVAPMPLAEIVSIAAQLASALETAHSAGIVHRDLKPANLMLTRGGRVKLLDFGLALWEGSSRLTDTAGGAVGTLSFMAPEQLRGEEVDARADLWSFGAVLYEMLTGRPPFVRGPHGSPQDLMQAILEREPPPLSEARPDTPAVLERIVARCLRKDPAARYASAGEIIDELRGAALLTQPHPRPDRYAEGPRLWLLLAAVILLVGVFVMGQRLSQRATAIGVRVLAPEVQGLPAAEEARLTSSLERALRQILREIDGIRVLEGAQPAREEIVARAYCGPQICQVILHRLDARDGRELWSESLQVPASRPADLVTALETRLRRVYPAAEP